MKGKTLLSLAIVLALLVSAMPLATVKAVTATMEIVFENGLHEITKAPCNNFTVTIKIVNAPEFTQWIAELEWDSAVLELQHAQNPPTPNGTTSDITEGPFMGTFGGTVFLVKQVNLSPGHIKEISEGYLSGGPASGTGEVCYIKFHCKGVGDTSITLTRHLMINGLVMVPCDGVDGLVHQPPPPATPPEAVITTPANGALVPVCNDVLLDGSMSTGGFDTLPAPGEACPITDWKWIVDNGTILELHGAHQSFHCDGPGLVTITLTVTAPDPTPPSAPGYVPTDSMTISIMQVPPSLGPAIDVYTATNGKGPLGDYPYGWSDAYGPQQLVTVYAKVTYNDEPVEYKPVAFEMIMPNGVAADYRTAFTDASGIATTTFRIPWEGSNAELLFGDWSIVGTVSISEVTVMDTLKFKFGYIVSIGSTTVTYTPPLKKGGVMTIDVQLDSISMSSHNVFLTIVACDTCGVPIGIAGGNFVVAPEDGLASGYTITIPSWAFVGTGTIYVNVFTGIPQYGGVPYCPEGTAIFILEKTS